MSDLKLDETINRTTLELKCFFRRWCPDTRLPYKSHHTGIEITSKLDYSSPGKAYKSHHTGIEINFFDYEG